MLRARVLLACVLSATAFVALVGCGGGTDSPGEKVEVSGGEFTRVTPQELSTLMKSKDFPLVNVHIPYEGELPGTDSFIPFDTIGHEIGQLPSDKSAKIVLYCRSGRMSTEAAEELVQLGYTNVWELGGGMQAWESAGLTLLQNKQ